MKKWGILFAMLIGICISCKKSELKKPTELRFTVGLDKTAQSGSLKFNSGNITFGKFGVTGNRIEGEDIDFERVFTAGLDSDLNGSAELSDLDFNLPQGSYTDLKVKFNIKEIDNEPSLVLNGTYVPTGGPAKGVEFRYTGNQEFNITAVEESGLTPITLDKNIDRKAKIEFDPKYWFETITDDQLNNATVTSAQGQDKIIISSDQNANLYSIIAPRISMSNTVTLK